MKKRKLINKFLFILIVGLFLIPLHLLAQLPNQAEGLTISPPLQEFEIQQSQSITKKIKVTNPIDKQVKVYPLAYDFTAKGESGEPDFMPPSEERRSYSLASWIKFSKDYLLLEPEEVEDFEYQISVPKDGEPGGHYGVVFFASEPPKLDKKEDSQVAISSMVGSLILAKVPGYIVENGQLETFSAPWFSFKPPVDFVARVKNLGNIHFKPKGDIQIKNFFGKTVGQVETNSASGNILPETVRKFTPKWEPKKTLFSPIGRYKAELKLTYGESKKELTGVLTFWIIPLWLIILVTVLLICAITWFIWKHKKKKNKSGKDQKVIDLRR